MAELQRSVTTFRRSGSSGLVWDEKLFTEESKKEEVEEEEKGAADQEEFRELRHSKSVGSIGMMGRSRSNGGGGGGRRAFRANIVSPSADPPSPEVPRCCGFFTKHKSARKIPKPRRQ